MKVDLQNITKYYGSTAEAAPAVDDVSMTIASGELFFLLGPSGCGKTTLLRIIAGLLEPTEGSVHFAGQEVTALPVEKRNTAMVFQNYALWPHMTITQNVEFGPKMRGRSRAERRSVVDENLELVQMAAFASRKPNQLSGGQQQRVALARALAAEADLLLLDEPLSNLDARLRAHMRTELRQLVKASGTTAVYVTHDQTEALSMADRIAVMDSGKIAQIGTPGELYDRPVSRFVADFLGEANFLEGKLIDTGCPATIETPVGSLPAADHRGIQAGSKVTCCIRPERIAISTEPGGTEPAGTQGVSGQNSQTGILATVKSSVYFGETTQYTCSLGESVLWKVSALSQAAHAIRDGQTVTLLISPADVCVLDR